MATYFGELVDKQSRAFWNEECDSDEDLDVGLCYNRKLQITRLCDTPDAKKDKLLLVIHGPLTQGFVKACVAEGECIAEIKEIEDSSCERRKRSKSTIRHITDEVSMCVCSADLDVTQAFDFTEKLTPWLKNAEQVMVLTCSHLSECYGLRVDDEKDVLLRALKTDDYKNPLLSEVLEQPNTLKGIPAAVLTWCQMSRIPAVAYVCITHSFQPDSSSVKPFTQLISKLPFKLLKEKPDFTGKTYTGHEISSNIYM